MRIYTSYASVQLNSVRKIIFKKMVKTQIHFRDYDLALLKIKKSMVNIKL